MLQFTIKKECEQSLMITVARKEEKHNDRSYLVCNVKHSLLLPMLNSNMKLDSATKKMLGLKGNYLTYLRANCNRRINNKRDNVRFNPQLVFEELCRALQTKKEG